jgi:hypothetical protein
MLHTQQTNKHETESEKVNSTVDDDDDDDDTDNSKRTNHSNKEYSSLGSDIM